MASNDLVFQLPQTNSPNLVFGLSGIPACPPDWDDQDTHELSIDFGYVPDFDDKNVVLDFACKIVSSCLYDWKSVAGDQLYVNIYSHSDWSYQSGDHIIVNVKCDIPENCAEDWQGFPSDEIEVDFICCAEDCSTGNYKDQPSDNIAVDFECCAQGEDDGHPIDLGIVNLANGESLSSWLDAQILIAGELPTGESLSSTLTFVGPIEFVSGFYQGETIDGPLWTDVALAADFDTSEYFNPASFNTYPSSPISAYLYVGEYLNSDIVTDKRLSAEIFTGENVSAILTDYPDQGMRGTIVTGESFEPGSMSIVMGFQTYMADGAALVSDVSTTTNLSVNFYHGTNLASDLRNAPAAELSGVLYFGESLTAELNIGDFNIGATLFYEGAVLSAFLDDFPSPSMVVTLLHGETFVPGILAVGSNLGDMTLGDGASLSVPGMAEVPNEHIYTGERFQPGEISTSTTFERNLEFGAALSAELYTRPSEPFGLVDMADGAYFRPYITTMDAIYMSATIYHYTDFKAGIPGIGTYFDLNRSCCDLGVSTSDFHNIELSYAEFIDEAYDGDKIKFTGDLRTLPRFSATMRDGVSLVTVPKDISFGSVTMWTGESVTSDTEMVLDFNLCPGNFIPDGDNVYVELSLDDNSECEAHYLYTGESLKVDSIRAYKNFYGDCRTGETLSCVLSTYPPLATYFYTGETFTPASEAIMSTMMPSGETLSATFYEPPVLMHTGEELTGTLVIQYDVKFMEQGCLDNEWVYMTPDGDKDEERTKPTAVEMEPFSHDIKAICF